IKKKIPKNEAIIIVCRDNFHGRSITIVGFSTDIEAVRYYSNFGPYTPGFVTIPYGDAEELENTILELGPEKVAGFLFEPIQGEAGVIVPPNGYLQRLREICDQNNILLIADEIQTGLGRTGKMFACDHENIRPDVLIIGKAFSGGFYPVSAVLADRYLLGLFKPGEHGSTFGGNPLGAAIARAALRVIQDENMVQNASEMGEYFNEQLAEIPSGHVKEVRGKGLLIGVELKTEAGGARRFCEELQAKFILAKETHENVIRFAPPLIIDRGTIDWALLRIREVLTME
ncbi:MAG: aminotransferase class III-fold pyridoxal phosphate-dependent enzyme, partial [Candidatus Heimdallarchaeota archaeon]|nr:aminotransferase class III-fold pyridoxal phosphate-dependent enzyme [Candidatus Heimdallarchaeota archaeon]